MPTTIWAIGALFTYGFILGQEKNYMDVLHEKSQLKYVLVMFFCLVTTVVGWPLILGGYVSDCFNLLSGKHDKLKEG